MRATDNGTRNRIYAAPAAYDAAFSYRDYDREVAEFLRWYGSVNAAGSEPESVLELACGPGRHLLALAGQLRPAVGVDLSAEMCAYCAMLAEREGVDVSVVQADMVAFDLDRRFDLVLLLLNSVSHLTEEASLLFHLRCVRRHLSDRGLYVIEASRPKAGARDGLHSWRATGRFGDVSVTWESAAGRERARLTSTVEGTAVDIADEFRMRPWATRELVAAAADAGLQLVAVAGDFSQDPPPGPAAWAELPGDSGVHPCLIFGR